MCRQVKHARTFEPDTFKPLSTAATAAATKKIDYYFLKFTLFTESTQMRHLNIIYGELLSIRVWLIRLRNVFCLALASIWPIHSYCRLRHVLMCATMCTPCTLHCNFYRNLLRQIGDYGCEPAAVNYGNMEFIALDIRIARRDASWHMKWVFEHVRTRQNDSFPTEHWIVCTLSTIQKIITYIDDIYIVVCVAYNLVGEFCIFIWKRCHVIECSHEWQNL